MSSLRASRLALAAAAALAVAGAAGGQDQGQGDFFSQQQLGELDPFAIGALTPEQGGLPPTLWSGSDLEGVSVAANRSPGETGFLAASELAARALLSGGVSPQPPGDRLDAAGQRLLALLNLGRLDAVDTIVATTPRGTAEPELAAVAVQALLAKNDIRQACNIGNLLQEGREAAFWLRLRAACYAWAGESSLAELTLELAREADDTIADEDFATWVLAAASRVAPLDAQAPRDALESALAQSAGYVFDAETLERMPLLVAVGIARNSMTAPDVRALAARRAARTGAVAPEELAAALMAMPAPPNAAAAALIQAAQSDVYPAADSLLVHAASATDASPWDTARAIDVALARAETPADFIVTAQMLAPVLNGLPPLPEMAASAPRFVLAAAAAGDRGLAYAWLDPRARRLAAPGAQTWGAADGWTPVLNSAPDFSRSPLEPAARIAAEAVVAAADPTASPRRLAAVAKARLDTTVSITGGSDWASARRDVLILLALGAEGSPELRRAAQGASEEAHPAGDIALQALDAAEDAARAGALGETALLLAQAVAEVGPGHAPTVARAIEIARSVGLDADARALAVEAMLASRIGAASVGG